MRRIFNFNDKCHECPYSELLAHYHRLELYCVLDSCDKDNPNAENDCLLYRDNAVKFGGMG